LSGGRWASSGGLWFAIPGRSGGLYGFGLRGAASLLLGENSVPVGRAEIDVDVPDPVGREGEELGVAELVAGRSGDLVEHEGCVVLCILKTLSTSELCHSDSIG
jgi:hypothetical protein